MVEGSFIITGIVTWINSWIYSHYNPYVERDEKCDG